jgi:hypothetical protein
MRITTGDKWVAALDERTWRSVKAPCAACQGTGLGTIYFDRGQAIHPPDAPPCGWCGGTGTRSVRARGGGGGRIGGSSPGAQQSSDARGGHARWADGERGARGLSVNGRSGVAGS